MINGCDKVPRDLRTVVTEEILAEAVGKHSHGPAKATAIGVMLSLLLSLSFM
jgi:hypothetical protein